MIKLRHSAALAVLLTGTTAFATNGDNMIGVGAQSRAMGGTGIALNMGAESAIKNPALLSKTAGYQFMFAGTMFMPNVETTNVAASQGSAGMYGTADSEADSFMIPAIALSHQINDEVTFGIGAYGTSGLGVDFRNADANDGLYRMSTALSIMQFIPAIAYKTPVEGLSVGAGLVIQYGSLGISYDRGIDSNLDAFASNLDTAFNAGGQITAAMDQFQGQIGSVGSEGSGTSDDLAMGFDIGAAYTYGAFTVGFNHKTAIEMEYEHQIMAASQDFGLTGFTDKLTQPAETGIGIAYAEGPLAVTADFKTIAWSSADGYEQFGWDDQTVVALGIAYAIDATTLRAGYNQASHPLGDDAVEAGSATNPAGYSIAAFNIIGFPATVESHITLGASHEFTKGFGMDFAYTMATETTTEATSYDQANAMEIDFETKHSQSALTVAARWSF